MPSVLQFYNDAFSDAGLQQPNQTTTGSNIDRVHRCFDDMVRAWSKVRERLFFIPSAIYPLTAGLGAYQIGPGAAQYNTSNVAPAPLYTRPLLIQTAQVIVGNSRKFSLNILTRPQWDVLQTQTLTDPDGPTDLFYDFGHPISTIYLAPLPGGIGWNPNQTLILSQWNPLKVFYPGDEQLNLQDYYPESYFLALRKGLSIQLRDAYHMPVDQQLLGIFQGALSAIENDNRSKVVGAFGPTRTLQSPTKGDDGIMQPGQPPQQQQ
jgi:hypothetical protein